MGTYKLIKTSNTMLHIGELIKEKMKEQHKSVVWLAKQLSCSRNNVYKILNKYSLDTELLVKISILLDFDFLSIYMEDMKRRKEKQ